MLDFDRIGKEFRIKGNLIGFSLIDNGNVNKTYKVDYDTQKSYIVQVVNTYVFKNPEAVMKNIDIVTEHLRKKYPDNINLHFHHRDNGLNYLMLDNKFIRIMNNVESITYDTCDELSVIENTGYAFGEFQDKLSDVDASVLTETIKDFHNTKKRLDDLFMSHKDNNTEFMEFFKNSYDKASEISILYSEGKFPVRVTHNDTKSNNILFDKVTHDPLVVIDLDTVMPGVGLNDFADGARFICNNAKEDDNNMNVVYFDLSKFCAYTKGFLRATKHTYTELEIKYMALSVYSITVELASRFFKDYLDGNKYFKINYKDHNLVRTKNQIKLAKDIEEKLDIMELIVRKYAK